MILVQQNLPRTFLNDPLDFLALNVVPFSYHLQTTVKLLGSISAALSSPVYVAPREESSGEEHGLLSRTAAGNRAYQVVFYLLTDNENYVPLYIAKLVW